MYISNFVIRNFFPLPFLVILLKPNNIMFAEINNQLKSY